MTDYSKIRLKPIKNSHADHLGLDGYKSVYRQREDDLVKEYKDMLEDDDGEDVHQQVGNKYGISSNNLALSQLQECLDVERSEQEEQDEQNFE